MDDVCLYRVKDVIIVRRIEVKLFFFRVNVFRYCDMLFFGFDDISIFIYEI